jgi:hypothetical protein
VVEGIARSNIGVVVLNPTRSMDVCFYSVFVFSMKVAALILSEVKLSVSLIIIIIIHF